MHFLFYKYIFVPNANRYVQLFFFVLLLFHEPNSFTFENILKNISLVVP